MTLSFLLASDDLMILYGEALLFGDVAVPYLFSKQMWQLLLFFISDSFCWDDCASCFLLCLFPLHGGQARGKGVGLFLSSIFPSAHLLLSFSLSLAEDELENCLHMLRGIIFTSLTVPQADVVDEEKA